MQNALIDKALSIATRAHAGQTDKGGKPYIAHPQRVAARCTTDDARIVALLHDTIEDTRVTADYLLSEGFPQRIVDAVLSVTRCEGESYDEFIDRAARNPIGRQVKIADLLDNMDITRLPYPLSPTDLTRLNQYLKAYKRLNNEPLPGRCYENFAGDELMFIHPDGSWTVKQVSYHVGGKQTVQTREFSKSQITTVEEALHKAGGSLGFRDYAYEGDTISFWDDRDHELICKVNEITPEEFNDFGIKWIWDDSGNHISLKNNEKDKRQAPQENTVGQLGEN